MLIITPTKPQDIAATFNLNLNSPNSNSLRESQEKISSYFPFPLTSQQQKALQLIEEFLNSQETFFLLGGYAGTGKSTIVFAGVKELIASRKRVALTAPTNKAVAILKNMAANNNMSDVSCLTIHQLLGLGMVNYGAEKVLQPTNPSTVHLYDVVFLDECSMVGEDLWNWIERVFDTSLFTKRKLVLMGDPAQLNPVGEKRSPTFQIQKRTILTQVVRQKGESPLLDFVTACRKTVNSKTAVFRPFSSYQSGDKSNGAFPVNSRTLIEYATRKIQREFEKNCNCFRILCYTNKQVDTYNRLIREAIHGKNAPRFILGERLITKNPVFAPDGKTLILPTSTEFTVIEIAETKYYGYQTYQLNVATDEGLIRQIFVLHESEQKRYERELEQKLNDAQRNPTLWRKYYWFRDGLFAQVSNCIAITIHNSQGSTFDEGAIDSNDLRARLFVGEETERQKRKEYNRLWYVGSSRFRQRLLVLKLNNRSVNRF